MGEARQGRPKLLVLTSTFPRWRGDACPTFVQELSSGLSRSFDVTVLAPGSNGARRFERWGDLTVRRYAYGWPPSSQRLADGAILPNVRRNRALAALIPTFVLAQLWSAWRLTRRESFDAVHAHWALPQGWVAATLQTRLGVPSLTTTHGADLYAFKTGLPLRAKRWAMQTNDRVTAVSNSLKQEVLALGVDERRVCVLPMGVDTGRFAPECAQQALRQELNADGALLLFVGRLVEKKGARYVLEAMPAILGDHPKALLAIIGDGPEREGLERLSSQLGLGDNVRFLGARPNDQLPAMFSSADLFVGPSVIEANGDTESFGVVFAEAMASGCPVIATDVGGITDIVVDGETGVLVPHRNARAIAAAASALLEDEAKRERLSRQSRAWVREQFDLRKTTAQYASLIEEMIAA